jgi:hypothetical protein
MKSGIRLADAGKALRRFHEDEAGNETVQTVMILAFGCLIMVGLHYVWKEATIGGDGGSTGVLGAIVSLIGDVFGLNFTGK